MIEFDNPKPVKSHSMLELHDTSKFWLQGWSHACQKIKSMISDSSLKIADSQAQSVLNELFSQVVALEKSGMNEMPTVVCLNSAASRDSAEK